MKESSGGEDGAIELLKNKRKEAGMVCFKCAGRESTKRKGKRGAQNSKNRGCKKPGFWYWAFDFGETLDLELRTRRSKRTSLAEADERLFGQSITKGSSRNETGRNSHRG